MTPVHIEFVPSKRWQAVWALALLLCLVWIAVFAARWMGVRQETEAAKTALDAAQGELGRLRAPVAVKADPRQASSLQAAKHLQQDLNAVFAVAENLKIAGVRLSAMGLDTNADKLWLDYEMQTLTQAAQVTEWLNSGYESRPWKLGAVSASQGPQGLIYKAHWSVRVSEIVQ